MNNFLVRLLRLLTIIFVWTVIFMSFLMLNLAFSTFPNKYIDKELLPYVEQVYERVNLYCDKGEVFNPLRTSIVFSDLDTDILGQCSRTPLFWKVEINKKTWDSLKTIEKQMLLFHELTHCLFKQSHIKHPVPHYMNEMIYEIPLEELLAEFEIIAKAHCKEKL